jgi:hypothetical protein
MSKAIATLKPKIAETKYKKQRINDLKQAV